MGQNGPKNINYSIYGHTFLGHNSAICRPNIYRLVLRNNVFDAFLKEILFLAGKWAWSTRWCQGVWDLKTRPKSWLIGWTFWVNRYPQKYFYKFLGLNPLTLLCMYLDHKQISTLGYGVKYHAIHCKRTFGKFY